MLDVKRGMPIATSPALKTTRRIKPAQVGVLNGQSGQAVAVKEQGRTLTWPWRYNVEKHGSRDLRLDLLRGFCIFVMLIDHIGIFGPDSWLYVITGKGEFFLSAAEGFVFISGLVMGFVYYKLIAKEGLSKAVPKILNRIVKLYWLAVGLTLFFSALAVYTPLKLWAERDWITISDPIELIVGSLTLHFAFHGSSIMVMYVLFIALTPLVFYALHKGKTFAVMAVSLGVWFANLYYPNQFTLPFASNFPVASWQVLFVAGLVIGWHRDKFANLLQGNWQKVYSVAVGAFAIFMLCVFVAYKAGTLDQFMPVLNEAWLWNELNDKGRIPIARMFLIFVYFQAFYLLTTWLWVPIQKALGWYLIPVGEKALYSYSIHLLLIVLVYNIPGFTELPFAIYGFAQLAAVSLILVAIKTNFLTKIIPS